METAAKQTTQQLIKLICDFIRSIGITIQEGGTGTETFFKGIVIRNGELIIDPSQIQHPGDLLHEAGHIAVASREERSSLNDNIMDNRPGKEGEEMATMLWSWAASLHLGIPAEIIFHEEGYRGQSKWIIDQYNNGNFIGIPFLIWMGLCKDPKEEGGFPEMLRWVRE